MAISLQELNRRRISLPGPLGIIGAVFSVLPRGRLTPQNRGAFLSRFPTVFAADYARRVLGGGSVSDQPIVPPAIPDVTRPPTGKGPRPYTPGTIPPRSPPSSDVVNVGRSTTARTRFRRFGRQLGRKRLSGAALRRLIFESTPYLLNPYSVGAAAVLYPSPTSARDVVSAAEMRSRSDIKITYPGQASRISRPGGARRYRNIAGTLSPITITKIPMTYPTIPSKYVKRLPVPTVPPAKPVTPPWLTLAPALLPLLLQRQPRAGNAQATVNVPGGVAPQPTPQPQVPPPQLSQFTQYPSAFVTSAQQASSDCDCGPKKPKKPKKPRDKCKTGTYTETATGLVKRPKRTVKCR